MQLGFRFYDPEIGRLTQLDPIGDGINWYAYCGGNPLGYVDPWGLSIWGDIIAPGLATGVAAVGSAASFGLWDGGRWKNQPGFGVSRGLGYVGIGAGAAAGGLAVFGITRAATATGTVMVTNWMPKGGDRVLEAGRWVMPGGQNWFNYLRSGVWDPFVKNMPYPYMNAATYEIEKAMLRLPTTSDGEPLWLLPIKIVFGQRIYTGPPTGPCP